MILSLVLYKITFHFHMMSESYGVVFVLFDAVDFKYGSGK